MKTNQNDNLRPRPSKNVGYQYSDIFKWLLRGVYVILLIIWFCCFSIVKVQGDSMKNSYQDGDYVVLYDFGKIERFDVVVLNERLKDGDDNKQIIKRVIGFGGEKVTVLDGRLYVNGKLFKEDYLDPGNLLNFQLTDFEIIVPKGYVFVLGDNRDVSKDSRHVGSFKLESIKGVVIYHH